jgi:hypothetical protein
MKEKLIIASGCSYTDNSRDFYLDNNITTWPELVAEELDIEFINLAHGGAPNDYICNSMTDAIFEYSDRDIIAMVLWTSSNRWYPCKGPERLAKEDWLVTYQLRCMWRLNEFCKQQQVPLYQGHSTSPLASLKIQDKPGLLIHNRYYDSKYFGPQKPWSNMFWMENKPYIIPGDGHPNQKAQDWIAEYFLLKYNGGEIEVPPDNYNTTEFVYD